MNEPIWLTGGTFDPVTVGHVRFFERAAERCGTLYIGIFINTNKVPRFSLERRLNALKKATEHINNTVVVFNDGYLADYALEIGASNIVKGVRDDHDIEYEQIQADFNYKRSGINTVFIRSAPEYSCISSSLVKELESEGKPYRHLLPDGVYEILYD